MSSASFITNYLSSSGSDVSCSCSVDSSRVSVSLSGPREAKAHLVSPYGLALDVTVRGLSLPSHFERTIESLVSTLLRVVVAVERFPGSQLSVSVGIVSDDGDVVAAALNSVMLSVIDLGLPLKTMAAAASAWLDNGLIAAKRTRSLGSIETVCLTQVLCLTTGKVLLSYYAGDLELKELRKASAYCIETAKKMNFSLTSKSRQLSCT